MWTANESPLNILSDGAGFRQSNCPEAGGSGSAIPVDLVLGGGDRLAGEPLGEASIDEFCEDALHEAVLQRVEGDDADSRARGEPGGRRGGAESRAGDAADGFQQRFERRQLIVDGDSQCLEGSRGRVDSLPRSAAADGRSHDFGEFRRGGYRRLFSGLDKFSGDEAPAALLAVVADDFGEFGFGELSDEVGRGHGAGGVVAHVEGTAALEGEAAPGVVHLGGGEAEVGENEIGAEAGVDHSARGLGEVGGEFGEGRGLGEGANACGGVGEIVGIGVDDGEVSAGADTLGDGGGVAPLPRGAIEGGFARPRIEMLDRLIEQDRNVRVGGRH